MAYWNLHERRLSKKTEEYFINDKYPLVFYHFSGFNPLIPDLLSKYQNRFTFEARSDVLELFKEYSDQLFLNGFKSYINYPNDFASIKNMIDEKHLQEEIRKIPLLKRALRKIILKIISIFNITMDYSILR
jgi:hypothetical protein